MPLRSALRAPTSTIASSRRPDDLPLHYNGLTILLFSISVPAWYFTEDVWKYKSLMKGALIFFLLVNLIEPSFL